MVSHKEGTENRGQEHTREQSRWESGHTQKPNTAVGRSLSRARGHAKTSSQGNTADKARQQAGQQVQPYESSHSDRETQREAHSRGYQLLIFLQHSAGYKAPSRTV